MSDIERALGFVDTITGATSLGTSIASEILQKHNSKYSRVDDFLASQIIENGIVTEDDYNTAARLLLIPQMRKKCKAIAKVIAKADKQCEQYATATGKKPSGVNDDWLAYFLDRASLISDDTVQTLWASIFTYECFEANTFRKVMLDKMALLDRDLAEAFGKLCSLVYDLKVSDGREYSIPLYLRDDLLVKMVSDDSTDFNDHDAINYQKSLPSEDDLEMLQEIGFITLSEDNDDCDIYSAGRIAFTATVGECSVTPKTQYDKKQKVYYILTSNAVFTGIGLELYRRIKNNFPPNDNLTHTLSCFMKSMGEF